PQSAPGIDQLTQQFNDVNLYGSAQQSYPPVGANPNMGMGMGMNMGANPNMQLSSHAAAVLPMNQLYTTDLLNDFPPPIKDLSLPPPPVILPNDATLSQRPESNASPDYFRCTLNTIPTTNSLLKRSKLPLGVVIRPYTTLHESENPVPVVKDTVIARCRRCRAYINPFVQFVQSDRRWRCNLCALQNDVPSAFDNMENGRTRYDREELNYAVVDFVAPSQYMVRSPEPLVYVFIIEVSVIAVKNGMLATVARTILESLDRIPNDKGLTRVAFLAVDSALHYFKIPESTKSSNPEKDDDNDDDDDEDEDDDINSQPQMLVVSDLDEPFLPCPDGLLVRLDQCRSQIETLLANLNDMFHDNLNPNFALGPALKAAHKLVQPIGGRIQVLGCSLPSLGVGKLNVREEESVSGKPKEAQTLMSAADSFYKSFAVECNKSQVTVDMFLCSTSYQDVATLANLPRYTAGQTHFYPAWSAAKEEDVIKLSKEFSNHLSMDVALEAVMRVRGSNGIRMASFYGNFFNRSSDLCSFPSFPRDQGYLIEMSLEDNITKPYICLQAAVLHTTVGGQRRIRVLNLAIPTTTNIADVFASADQLAIANFYAQKAVEKVFSNSFQDARDLLMKHMLEILQVYKKECVSRNVGSSSPLQLSTNLRMLPLLLHSMIKHIAFRTGKVPSDHRAAALNFLGSAPLPKLIKNIYPSIYSLHNMEDECGLVDENTETIIMPNSVNATAVTLERFGLYLIDNACELFLWVGGEAVPQLIQDVFGIEDISNIPVGKCELPVLNDSPFNQRIRNIIQSIRDDHSVITWQSLYVVKGPSPSEPIARSREVAALRMWASSEFVEDKQSTISYREFLGSFREKISN
ncbi:COPII subunit SEC24, partial [Ascoidea rubescens DSM 1968]